MSEPIQMTTLYGAQVELGGEAHPYSEATVRRMIRDGARRWMRWSRGGRWDEV